MKLLILLQCCVLLCKLTAGYEGGGYREGLGMENGKIADNQITASSEKTDYKAVNARLSHKNQEGRPLGWQPLKNSRYAEWLQVDLLLDNYTVTGVATQGCLANSTQKVVFSVTKYELEYSNDNEVFSTNHKLYEGNTDESTVVYHALETPIKARYIRFQPRSWKENICMRVELYGNIVKACDSSPCLNGGTCFEDETGEEYICKCTSGWKGDNCEQNFTACDSSPCLNGGTCFEDEAGEEYICKCTSGWEGDNCEQNFTGCDSSPCLNGGTCFQDKCGVICKCTSGWKGDNCEEKNITACDSSPCLNGGTCFQDKSGVEEYICKCTGGWKGDNCKEKKFTACDSSPCLNGGTCFQDKSGVKEYICKCTGGWKGDNCKENNIRGLEDSVIVGNNRNYLRNLSNWLSPVARSVNSAWKRCWRASVDGWAAITFHSRCDGKGPTVTIIRVQGKYIFGGYTSVSWHYISVNKYDPKAFLFSLVNKPGWAPVKLPQTGKYSSLRAHSIYCVSSYGPTFGGGNDIYISDYASSKSDSYNNLGHTYSPPSGYSYGSTFAQTFLAGSYTFTPDEVETFYETNKK